MPLLTRTYPRIPPPSEATERGQRTVALGAKRALAAATQLEQVQALMRFDKTKTKWFSCRLRHEVWCCGIRGRFVCLGANPGGDKSHFWCMQRPCLSVWLLPCLRFIAPME